MPSSRLMSRPSSSATIRKPPHLGHQIPSPPHPSRCVAILNEACGFAFVTGGSLAAPSAGWLCFEQPATVDSPRATSAAHRPATVASLRAGSVALGYLQYRGTPPPFRTASAVIASAPLQIAASRLHYCAFRPPSALLRLVPELGEPVLPASLTVSRRWVILDAPIMPPSP